MAEDFHGMATRSLENEYLQLDYLVEAGPRLVRLFLTGSPVNLLADVFDFKVPRPSMGSIPSWASSTGCWSSGSGIRTCFQSRCRPSAPMPLAGRMSAQWCSCC